MIFDFQPLATSNVSEFKVVDDGIIGDTLTVFADPDYGDGEWLLLDGEPVPVTFKGTAYYHGEMPSSARPEIPETAKPVATASRNLFGSLTHTSPRPLR